MKKLCLIVALVFAAVTMTHAMELVPKPVFPYRGAMLDCSRHFWTVEQIKTVIDVLSMHKLNVFHWHLTDNQGYRKVCAGKGSGNNSGNRASRTCTGRFGKLSMAGLPWTGV